MKFSPKSLSSGTDNKACWDFDLLVELCQERTGLTEKELVQLSKYIYAFGWKYMRINYYSENVERSFRKLQKLKQDFKKAETWEYYCADIESIIQALCSMTDVLAQIINIIVFNGNGKDEKNVNFYGILKRLKKEKKDLNLTKILTHLKEEYSFRYVCAFCNTIKHRRLVEISDINCRFEGFEYENIHYRGVLAETMYSKYIHKIKNRLFRAGSAINKYLEESII